MEALWRLDVTLGSTLAAGRDPMASLLRLAWWREALERLDGEEPPPEPVLQALAAHVIPRIGGAELAAMEEGWSALVSVEGLDSYAAARGGLLFGFTARLLGEPGFPVAQAGALWALADLARRSARPEEAGAALAAAAAARLDRRRWPRSLRPLGMLAVLARRDVERGLARRERPGAPARMLRMLRHRLTGA